MLEFIFALHSMEEREKSFITLAPIGRERSEGKESERKRVKRITSSMQNVIKLFLHNLNFSAISKSVLSN